MNEAVPTTVSQTALEDLRQRLRRTRHTANPWADDAARGIPAPELDTLLDRWATEYDWRTHESRIRDLPWTLTGVGSSAVRSIHQPVSTPGAPTVVLLHGWPDSVLRFERLLPLLTDVNVVVPALPGFPFSPPLDRPVTAAEIAHLVGGALAELGYDRYVVSGGDVGGTVAEILAAEYPERVTAVHLTSIAAGHVATADPGRLSAEAADYLRYVGEWRRTEAGFIAEQSTRPGTLIASLGDSPAGLLAWIAEKLVAWSDSSHGDPAFEPDDLLTWASIYWFTGTIGTSFSTYVEPSRLPSRVETPFVFSSHARDIIAAPRSFAEAFLNVREFIEHDSGGHFAAWEQPVVYASDLRRAVALTADVVA